jgi:hypothetical protein
MSETPLSGVPPAEGVRSAPARAGDDPFVLSRANVGDGFPAAEAIRGGRCGYWTKGQLTARDRWSKFAWYDRQGGTKK